MKKISVTRLQSHIGEATTLLISGEEIMLTKNRKDLAVMVPVKKYKLKRKYPDYKGDVGGALRIFPKINVEVKGKDDMDVKVHPQVFSESSTFHRCQAPNTNCRFPGTLYQVTFMDEEGEQKKQVYLCPGHAKRARDAGETLVKL